MNNTLRQSLLFSVLLVGFTTGQAQSRQEAIYAALEKEKQNREEAATPRDFETAPIFFVRRIYAFAL